MIGQMAEKASIDRRHDVQKHMIIPTPDITGCDIGYGRVPPSKVKPFDINDWSER